MTDFDEWLCQTYAETQGFTLLIILVYIENGRVDLQKSTHLHVIGDEMRWPDMADMLNRSGCAWNGVVMYRAGREGLVRDAVAKDRLASLVKHLRGDRGLIREGAFFNRDGLSLRLEEDSPPVLI